MKRGYLDRDEDISGITGVGSVAEFVISSDGRVAIFWPVGVGQFPSLEAAIEVHGHKGKTRFVVLDDPEASHCPYCHQVKAQVYGPHVLFCPDNHKECPGCLEGVK